MKTVLTTLLSTSLLALPALADNNSGQHRAGIGFNKVTVSGYLTNSQNHGDGLKLEYGYEFNHIVGMTVQYAKNKDSNYLAKIDGTKLQVDTDIGYKFFHAGMGIKPYFLVGFARHTEDQTLFYTGKTTYKDTSIVGGLGVRADFSRHFYSDMRFDIASYDHTDYDTFSWTFGYRF